MNQKVLIKNIIPRKMGFKFSSDIPRYWFANDQFKSILMTAFSATLPEGERFFIRSLRNYQTLIKNEQLKLDVSGFIGQEAHHGNEHDAFNALMSKLGMPTNEVEDLVRRFLFWYSDNMSKERQLAKTVALEHFTAIFGELILLHPEVLDGAHPEVKQLWMWHALEEVEHKSVAFDVYKEQVSNEWIRKSEMFLNTFTFIGFYAYHYFQIKRKTNDKTDWKSMIDGWKWLLGVEKGLLPNILSQYFEFYSSSFHPDQRDTQDLVSFWRSKLLSTPSI